MVEAKPDAGAKVHVVLGEFALYLGAGRTAVGPMEASEKELQTGVADKAN